MSSKTLVFIDSRVENYSALLAASPTNSLLLNAEEDGVLQIARALAGYRELDSIHIVSHGSPAALTLGSGGLNADNLAQYQTVLLTIGQALSATGDVLLYGCNVAQGAAGQAFVAALAVYTGADVAASEDLTGAVALGGDGVLEQVSGSVEAVSLPVDWLKGVLAVNTAPTFLGDGKVILISKIAQINAKNVLS
jgi:hypothetical protein